MNGLDFKECLKEKMCKREVQKILRPRQIKNGYALIVRYEQVVCIVLEDCWADEVKWMGMSKANGLFGNNRNKAGPGVSRN